MCRLLLLYKNEPKQVQLIFNQTNNYFKKTTIENLTKVELFDFNQTKQELQDITTGFTRALKNEEVPRSHIQMLKKHYRKILPQATHWQVATGDPELIQLLTKADKLIELEAKTQKNSNIPVK